jgi:hypothetical protein
MKEMGGLVDRRQDFSATITVRLDSLIIILC